MNLKTGEISLLAEKLLASGRVSCRKSFSLPTQCRTSSYTYPAATELCKSEPNRFTVYCCLAVYTN